MSLPFYLHQETRLLISNQELFKEELGGQLVGVVGDSLYVYLNKDKKIKVQFLNATSNTYEYQWPLSAQKMRIETFSANLFSLNFFRQERLSSRYVFKHHNNQIVNSCYIKPEVIDSRIPIAGGRVPAILSMTKELLTVWGEKTPHSDCPDLKDIPFENSDFKLSSYSKQASGSAFMYRHKSLKHVSSYVYFYPNLPRESGEEYYVCGFPGLERKGFNIYSASIFGKHGFLISKKDSSSTLFHIHKFVLIKDDADAPIHEIKKVNRFCTSFSVISFENPEMDRSILEGIELVDCKETHTDSCFLFKTSSGRWAITLDKGLDFRLRVFDAVVEKVQFLDSNFLVWGKINSRISKCYSCSFSDISCSLESLPFVKVPSVYTICKFFFKGFAFLSNVEDHLLFADFNTKHLNSIHFYERYSVEKSLVWGNDCFAYLVNAPGSNFSNVQIAKISKSHEPNFLKGRLFQFTPVLYVNLMGYSNLEMPNTANISIKPDLLTSPISNSLSSKKSAIDQPIQACGNLDLLPNLAVFGSEIDKKTLSVSSKKSVKVQHMQTSGNSNVLADLAVIASEIDEKTLLEYLKSDQKPKRSKKEKKRLGSHQIKSSRYKRISKSPKGSSKNESSEVLVQDPLPTPSLLALSQMAATHRSSASHSLETCAGLDTALFDARNAPYNNGQGQNHQNSEDEFSEFLTVVIDESRKNDEASKALFKDIVANQ